MWEEHVILKHEAHAPPLDRQIDAGSRIEVKPPVERNAPFIWRHDSGDGAQTRRLSRAGMAKEYRHAAPRLEFDVESERPPRLASIVPAPRPAFSSELFSNSYLQHVRQLHSLRPINRQLVRQINGGDRHRS